MDIFIFAGMFSRFDPGYLLKSIFRVLIRVTLLCQMFICWQVLTMKWLTNARHECENLIYRTHKKMFCLINSRVQISEMWDVTGCRWGLFGRKRRMMMNVDLSPGCTYNVEHTAKTGVVRCGLCRPQLVSESLERKLNTNVRLASVGNTAGKETPFKRRLSCTGGTSLPSIHFMSAETMKGSGAESRPWRA